MRRLAVVLALVLSTGCARYSVVQQGPTDVRALQEMAPVRATAIQFAFPQEWESSSQWNEHVAAWNEAYLAGLAKAGRDLGVRRPDFLAPGTIAPDGLVITSTVRQIQRGSAMTGDTIVVEVVIVEAATRRITMSATLEVTSVRMAGPEGYTFGGRIKFACLNLADAIVEALSEGHFRR
jgi:hypothetical protein